MRGVIPVWARHRLPVDAGRRPVAVRVASHIVYKPISALAIKTL